MLDKILGNVGKKGGFCGSLKKPDPLLLKHQTLLAHEASKQVVLTPRRTCYEFLGLPNLDVQENHPNTMPGAWGSGPMVSGWLMQFPALFIGVPSGK